MGNLSTPNSVQKLQTALHAKAKAEAGYRFYALYDKISREDILAHAYAQCRSNKGAPGVDGQDFADIDAYGVQRWLGELAIALRQETYRPEPIRRVFIPKANGKLRPLGISTLRDRVCMTAAMLVLEPIFEADLPPEQYAYRCGRNAQQAVVEVRELVFRGHSEVVDADLADYFGSIPHAELLKSVARRIVDRRVLHLIKMWLECPVEETDDRGRMTRTTEARDKRRSIPQGSPISPLLANLYMRRFVLGWKMLGLERSLGSRIVTYADDLVILCRRGKAEEALRQLRMTMGRLKLMVNEEKTRLDHGCNHSLELGNFDGDLLQQPRLHFLHRFRPGVLAPVLQLGLQVEQPLPRIHDLRQLLARRIVSLARNLAECLGKPADHLGIDRIVLGQPPGRSGEAAHPLGVDDPDFDVGFTQRLGPVPLIATARLHGRLADLVLAKPADQRAPSLCAAREHLPSRQRANARIHLVLCHVDTDDNEIALCHHPAPFLARSGLEAHATVRVEEDTGSVPRSPSGSRGLRHETGSDPATGGCREPPVRTFCQILRTQEHEVSRKTTAQGRPDCLR